MALIFENIIKDLSQIGFFSKYKFRKTAMPPFY